MHRVVRPTPFPSPFPSRAGVPIAWLVGVSLLAAPAAAVTLSFSDASSDTTPVEWLAATASYELLGPSTMALSVRNDTGADAPFDITLLFFNAGPTLDYVELVRATSSSEGDNTLAWHVGQYGYDLATAGFGSFDFSLRTGYGAPQAHRISPGETQHFTLAVHCAGYVGCREDALDGWSEGGPRSASAAIRFAYGPNGDAAFGARMTPVPEPGTGWLLGAALGGVAFARRRRWVEGVEEPGRGRASRSAGSRPG